MAHSASTRVRAAAANALADILDHSRTLDDAISRHGSRVAETDRPLLRELVAGSCRRFHEIDAILDGLLDKPLKRGATPVKGLLLSGIYQLLHMRVPAHAVINESVEAVRVLRQAWAAGLCNAVLRRVSTGGPELVAALPENARLAHPAWLLRQYRANWPGQAEAIIDAGNHYPPMTLRLNLARVERDQWLALAAEQGLGAQPCQLSPCGVTLDKPVPVERIPGFSDGTVSVQDEAAQLCAQLLDCQDGERVLDACAAPGGKTGLLLERTPGIRLSAMDIHADRLQRVRDNLDRLGLSAELICGDASGLEPWWDGEPFQRILVDAPCSGTGVIRRHPDIKILRKPDQIDALNLLQSSILDALWQCLAPGGTLLYATCSVLPAENENIVAAFCERTADASSVPIDLDAGISTPHGRQLLPGTGGYDGFFYALLRKG